MNIIKFNNEEFEVESYNKNTNFSGEIITSNGYCSLRNANMANLTALAQTTITSIEIVHDGTSIYKIENLNAKINSIDENFGGDRMFVNINLVFN